MRTRSLTAIASLAALLPVFLYAQEPPARGAALEEVVVTAQKRSESTQDVPFSVAAITEEGIQRAGANNIVELARNVAGLTITDLGPGQSQVAIRGISAGQVVRDQAGVKESVGIYLDESPISVALFTPDLDLYDLERLEVLVAPTLLVGSSACGALHHRARRQGSMQSTRRRALTVVGGGVKGAVNLPGRRGVARGHYYNDMAGSSIWHPGRGKDDVNEVFRVALLIQPNERLSITRVVYQKPDDASAHDVYNPLGNPQTPSRRSRRQPVTSCGRHRRRLRSATARVMTSRRHAHLGRSHRPQGRRD